MKNSETIASSGLLKEDILTGTEMFIFDKDGVKNILNFICEKWDHEKRCLTYKIQTTDLNDENSSFKNVCIKGYNQYNNSDSSNFSQKEMDSQAQNTILLKHKNIVDFSTLLPAFKAIVNYINNTYQVKVFSGHILCQSSYGNKGAKETIFKWHKDNENEEKNSVLTCIVLLNDQSTSMQIAGYKKTIYQGAGTGIFFLSGLIHR